MATVLLFGAMGGSGCVGTSDEECGELDYCACAALSDLCVPITEDCFCPCDEACSDAEEGACNCVCGGGAYLGCEDVQ